MAQFKGGGLKYWLGPLNPYHPPSCSRFVPQSAYSPQKCMPLLRLRLSTVISPTTQKASHCTGGANEVASHQVASHCDQAGAKLILIWSRRGLVVVFPSGMI